MTLYFIFYYIFYVSQVVESWFYTKVLSIDVINKLS